MLSISELQLLHQVSLHCKSLLMLPKLLLLVASDFVHFRVDTHFLPTSSYPHTTNPREVVFQSFGICPRAIGIVIIIILSKLLQDEIILTIGTGATRQELYGSHAHNQQTTKGTQSYSAGQHDGFSQCRKHHAELHNSEQVG